MPTVCLLITGKVQGVFYRATAKRKANELGITGWIKNTGEGNVEATVSGDEQQLNEFINWCKHGPDRAIVEKVIVSYSEDIVFDGFVVLK